MGLEEEFKFLDQKDFGTEAVECYPEIKSCVKVVLILKFIYCMKAQNLDFNREFAFEWLLIFTYNTLYLNFVSG